MVLGITGDLKILKLPFFKELTGYYEKWIGLCQNIFGMLNHRGFYIFVSVFLHILSHFSPLSNGASIFKYLARHKCFRFSLYIWDVTASSRGKNTFFPCLLIFKRLALRRMQKITHRRERFCKTQIKVSLHCSPSLSIQIRIEYLALGWGGREQTKA